MKTIGQILKESRLKKNYSLKKLEELTRIRSSFINLIEKEQWGALPPFPTVLGFVKTLASNLDVSEKSASAFLKRDYPPRSLNINPKPDVSSKFVWSPKVTFIAATALVIVGILGYLVSQYSRFKSAPKLSVESPKENQIIEGGSVLVFGTTDQDAKIMVNNQPVLVDEDGKFTVSIGVSSETKEILIEAISRSGKTSLVTRKIEVK